MIREKPNSYKAEFRESLVNVFRSAYYDWLDRSPTATEKEDRTLTEMIVKAFTKSRATYGTRRLKRELFNQDRITKPAADWPIDARGRTSLQNTAKI